MSDDAKKALIGLEIPWDDRGNVFRLREREADVIVAALAAAGLTPRKEPTTIAELQAEIGRLQSRLHFLVLGDQTKGVSFSSATPGAQP